MKTELDPSGLQPGQPGAKLDAGKVRPSLILGDMARALLAVAEVGTDGAIKYSDGGWQHVSNGIKRYIDAKDRHRLHGAMERRDPTTGHLHLAHEAWNALAALELMLREEEREKAGRTHRGGTPVGAVFVAQEPSEQVMRESYGGTE